MVRLLHEQHEFSERFVKHLLSRNIRYETGLIDQFLDSSEERLARILLLLGNFGRESRTERIVSRISRENMTQRAGTTRAQISHFMNKFRDLGFIGYSDNPWPVNSP